MTAPTGLVPRPRQAPQLPRPGPGNHFASHDLVPEPASAAEARRFTHDSLAAWAVTVDPSDAEIITSELVTNATQHAGPAADGRPAIILSLIASPAGLTISVWDNGPCDALCGQSSAASDDAEDGRGLLITHALTGGQWGWWETPCSPGKVIWAHLTPST
jgi:anti-sigma regulatory factor (Ser/Thr protein kinase)